MTSWHHFTCVLLFFFNLDVIWPFDLTCRAWSEGTVKKIIILMIAPTLINTVENDILFYREPMSLKLSKVLTTVPARSKVNVLAMARPYRRVFYTWHIYYQLQSADGNSMTTAFWMSRFIHSCYHCAGNLEIKAFCKILKRERKFNFLLLL